LQILKPYALKQVIMTTEAITSQTTYATDKRKDDVYEDEEEPLAPSLDQH
jgi:hypothetical protein